MTIYNCLTAIFPGEPDSTTSGPSPPVPEQNLWELNQLIEQDFYQLDIFPATKAMKGTQSTGPNQWLANRWSHVEVGWYIENITILQTQLNDSQLQISISSCSFL